MADAPKPPDEGQQFIFRPYITLPDGTVIWARKYGKKAFRIPVGPVSDR